MTLFFLGLGSDSQFVKHIEKDFLHHFVSIQIWMNGIFGVSLIEGALRR